jgi:hypothetical protein
MGWLGDMRALLTPSVDIDINEERYGGVHQGLNGARTMDVMGYRTTYGFAWDYMTEDDWSWLRAMYTRQVTQPQYLINPLRRNLLSPQASTMQCHRVDDLGVQMAQSAGYEYRNDFPSGVQPAGTRVPIVTSTTFNASYFRVDGTTAKFIPMNVGEPVTYSIYAKADAPVTVTLLADCFDKYSVSSANASTNINLTTSWQRFSLTMTPLATQAGGRLAVLFPTAGVYNARFAAPQVEYGSVATAWSLGGGSSRALIDQLTTSSHRFPLSDIQATILEG